MWLGRDGGSGARDALRELVWTCDPALAGAVAGAVRALGDRDTLAAAVTRRSVVIAVDRFIHRPVIALALVTAARARRLRSGRLSAYLLYVLVSLALALALIPILR